MLTIQKSFNARYATEVDVDFVRKSVRAIGRCAIKVEVSSTSIEFFKPPSVDRGVYVCIKQAFSLLLN